MHSSQRWAFRLPRTHNVPRPTRASYAAYSSSSVDGDARAQAKEGLTLSDLRRAKDWKELARMIPELWNAVLAKKENEPKEVVANSGDAAIPKSTKGRRNRFQLLEGKSMRPVSDKASAWKSNAPDNVTVLEGGVLRDSAFKPLEDAQAYRRSCVPKLAHGLEVVLSRRGVHWLRDPESKQYNFDQYLEDIPRVDDFAYDRLPGFVPSSQDKALIEAARKTKSRYVGSTSSLTGILTQIYLLLSEEKLVSTSHLSTDFSDAPRYFTPGQRIPVSVILNYQEGVYTTDYDSSREEDVEDIILLPLGTLLEKFLTLPKKSFKKFMKDYQEGNHPQLKDVHRYAKHGKFLMRSQLDCVADSLPGTGVFDLKTRAISPIRHDVYNYTNYLNCTLDALTGRRGTFEEEYYDMIRAAFLEYSFQARIGNMDGIFVAYHNTARIFGFQYVSLNEMDRCLFGREGAGTKVFSRCVWIMEMLYKRITQCFPEKSVKCTFEKRGQCLRVWVEPVEHSDPSTPPPIAELKLSLQSILNGKASNGNRAVGATAPWWISYRIERVNSSREDILYRREKAYKRQESIERSLPDAVKVDPAEKAPSLEQLLMGAV